MDLGSAGGAYQVFCCMVCFDVKALSRRPSTDGSGDEKWLVNPAAAVMEEGLAGEGVSGAPRRWGVPGTLTPRWHDPS